MKLIFKYVFFVLLAILANLFFQYLTLRLYNGTFDLYLALLIGTFAGLLLKYILDKKFIFNYKAKDKKDDGKKFFLYSLMGIFTTFIFWGFEISFDYAFKNNNSKYIGGFIGLSIGYITKYFLDKKFVFNN